MNENRRPKALLEPWRNDDLSLQRQEGASMAIQGSAAGAPMGKYRELEMYFYYQMISKKDENPTERQLAELAVEATVIRLQVDHVPEVHFIEETPSGHIRFDRRILGYCAVNGYYICLRAGLTPKDVVETAIHETRHSFQTHDPKWRMCDDKTRERDARLFQIEFFGSRSNSGDAPQLMRTLNQILKEDLDRLWKKACAEARAKPTSTESDQLRAQFAPVLKARTAAIQESIDPTGRGLFPSNIEFGPPQSGLTVGYQK